MEGRGHGVARAPQPAARDGTCSASCHVVTLRIFESRRARARCSSRSCGGGGGGGGDGRERMRAARRPCPISSEAPRSPHPPQPAPPAARTPRRMRRGGAARREAAHGKPLFAGRGGRCGVSGVSGARLQAIGCRPSGAASLRSAPVTCVGCRPRPVLHRVACKGCCIASSPGQGREQRSTPEATEGCCRRP